VYYLSYRSMQKKRRRLHNRRAVSIPSTLTMRASLLLIPPRCQAAYCTCILHAYSRALGGEQDEDVQVCDDGVCCERIG